MEAEKIEELIYRHTELEYGDGRPAQMDATKAAAEIAKLCEEEQDELVVWLTAKANTIYDDDEPMDRGRASAYREIAAHIERGSR